jgi:hypothetical protein
MNNRELFDFITRLDLEEEKVDEYINTALGNPLIPLPLPFPFST